jgi:hypothetical protein
LQLFPNTRHYSVVRGITNGGNVLESISDGFMVDVTPPRIEIDRYSSLCQLIASYL